MGFHILIVKPSSLGDIIHTLPVVPMIREKMPEAVISWVVGEQYAGLLELVSGIDHVIVFRRNRWNRLRYWPELICFFRQLRRRKVDLVLDFQGLFRSALISRASGAERRVGFRNAREGAVYFYNERVSLPENLCHAVERNLFMARTAMQVGEVMENCFSALLQSDRSAMEEIFHRHDLSLRSAVLAVTPGARWQAKLWSPEFFAAVLASVWRKAPDLPVLMLGSPDERYLGDIIVRQCGGQGKLVNLMGRTDLGTLVAILGHSRTVLTNDSGPMHIAAMLGTPVVALFGATDPRLTGPYGHIHRVFQGDCDRGPCLAKVCPKGTNACHHTVASDEVAQAVLEHFNSQ